MRLLALVPDAFGGRGGIAAFNRQMLAATCDYPGIKEVTALPRLIFDEGFTLPSKLRYDVRAAHGRAAYIMRVGRILTGGPFEGVLCGHMNLLPLAAIAARRFHAPLVLVGYGVEAWRASSRLLVRPMLRHVDRFVSISEFTRDRFLAWAPVPRAKTYVVPPCVDISAFGVGPKPRGLLQRYGLTGRPVLLTVARLSSAEQYKGIDQILELLPSLAEAAPNLAYLVVGDGDDRARLAAKASRLGLAKQVIFAGHVPEEEKADHYRVADVFVMPGRGEGFGIVYLEALACGIPVIASSRDASREAVRDGLLGLVVDPDNPREIRDAVLMSLAHRERRVPGGLEYFSVTQFQNRWRDVLAHTLA